MILTTHILAGSVVGKYIDQPVLVATTALALHFALDHFRHGEYLTKKSVIKDSWKTALDMGVGFGFVFLYSNFYDIPPQELRNILIAVFFSLFPDALTLLYWEAKMKFLKKIYQFHVFVHRYPPFSHQRDWNLRNSINDILFSLAALVILFFL